MIIFINSNKKRGLLVIDWSEGAIIRLKAGTYVNDQKPYSIQGICQGTVYFRFFGSILLEPKPGKFAASLLDPVVLMHMMFCCHNYPIGIENQRKGSYEIEFSDWRKNLYKDTSTMNKSNIVCNSIHLGDSLIGTLTSCFHCSWSLLMNRK
jgi:hypothetical protein